MPPQARKGHVQLEIQGKGPDVEIAGPEKGQGAVHRHGFRVKNPGLVEEKGDAHLQQFRVIGPRRVSHEELVDFLRDDEFDPGPVEHRDFHGLKEAFVRDQVGSRDDDALARLEKGRYDEALEIFGRIGRAARDGLEHHVARTPQLQAAPVLFWKFTRLHVPVLEENPFQLGHDRAFQP